MITSKELREGNYVLVEGFQRRVAGTIPGYVYFYKGDDPQEWRARVPDDQKSVTVVEAILLTEEWLLGFGFTPMEYGNDEIQWGRNDTRTIFTIDQNGRPVKDMPFEFIHDEAGVLMTYVHQLQNLYFVLTNEELKIDAG